MCGDVTASAAVSLGDLFFGRWPGPDAVRSASGVATIAGVGSHDGGGASVGSAAAILPLPKAPEKPLEAQVRKDSRQAMVCMGWLGPAVGAREYAAMKVLNTILGGGMASRYFLNIRNKESLAYVAQSYFPTRMLGGAVVAVVGTTPEKTARVRELVLAEAAKIVAEGVSSEEIDRAKAYLVGSFAMDRETGVARAQYLSWFELIGVGYRYEVDYPAQILAVTADEVKAVAAKYLVPDRVVTAITGPKQ